MKNNLEPIIEYQMTELEALSYKIGLLWVQLSKKVFPDYTHNKGYPAKGDPRKSSLFSYAYKLAKETKGLLKPEEYKLYIFAQLKVLRGIDLDGSHPMIAPCCMVGPPAWVRWQIWKKQYDKMSKTVVVEEIKLIPLADITRDLMRTKKFLLTRLESYQEKDILLAFKDLERWVVLGKVSPFYVILSPWAKKLCKDFKIDLDVYAKSVTKEVEDSFKSIFSEEFT